MGCLILSCAVGLIERFFLTVIEALRVSVCCMNSGSPHTFNSIKERQKEEKCVRYPCVRVCDFVSFSVYKFVHRQ